MAVILGEMLLVFIIEESVTSNKFVSLVIKVVSLARVFMSIIYLLFVYYNPIAAS